jgi:hypothetical protein
MLLWQICHRQRCKFYVPVFGRNYIVTNFHSFTPINAALKKRNGRFFIVFFSAYSLAKQIVMTCKSLRSYPVFVSVAVKHLKTEELITYEAISITYSECMFVALVIHHAKRMRRVILSCGLYGPCIFLYIIS